MQMFIFLTIILLVSSIGCQQTAPLVLESEQIALASSTPPGILQPTPLARSITPPEAPLMPTPDDPPPVFTPVQLAGPIFTPLLQASPTLPPGAQIIGYSVQGRAIIARQIGSGPRALLLVGGMHGGWEQNTVTLINELITHFEQTPEDILPGMALVFVPVANPDGLLHGQTEAGRFNANRVDLNRNWDCEWSPQARWRDQFVNAGERPFSEPETLALAAFVQELRPALALFYHSAAGGVFAGECNGDHGSMLMSQILGQATGYTYGQVFSAYPVTGTAASWVDGQGIPSADVELQTQTQSEFERNLNGIMALQRWLAG